MIIILPQVRVEAANLLMVKAVTNNLEVSHNKDLSIVNISFRIIDIREAHVNRTILNMAITVNPTFREINCQTSLEHFVLYDDSHVCMY